MVKGQVLALIVMMFLLVTGIEAQEEPGIKTRVNDYAGLLSDSQKHQLHQILLQHQFAKKNYITIVTAVSSGNESVDAYADKLMQTWESQKKPNSVLFLLLKDQKAAIVSGGALEGKMNRVEAKQLINEYVIPSLRKKDYDTAAMDGVKAITGVLNR